MAERACSIDGCGKPFLARDMCRMHYWRWKRHGDPMLGAKPTRQECSIDGCAELVEARGWCELHYNRWRRHGDPMLCMVGHVSAFIEVAARYQGDDCLPWPYALGENGYGQVSVRRQDGSRATTSASRAVLGAASGPPPHPDMQAAHAPDVCHNRACVNPRHLRWATPAENMADKRIDGTVVSALTDAKAAAIALDRRPPKQVAAEYGISSSTVRDIRKGRSWTHVDLAAHAHLFTS